MIFKVSDCLLNYNIYPRKKLNDFNVRRLCEALDAGAVFPPIILDRKSSMVVDGFHRIEAVRQRGGMDAEIEAELHDYDNLQEIFLDSVRFNAKHGKPLAEDDRDWCKDVAGSLKIRPAYLASALGISVDCIVKRTPIPVSGKSADRMPVMVNRSRQMTVDPDLVPERKPRALERKRPDRLRFYVNRIITMIKGREIDPDQADNRQLLEDLVHGINVYLKTVNS